MNKVVIISTVGLIYDGITSVIVSYLEAMDKTDLEIYVVNTIKSEPKILDRITDLGCKVVDLPSRKTETLSYFIQLTDFIKKIELILCMRMVIVQLLLLNYLLDI